MAEQEPEEASDMISVLWNLCQNNLLQVALRGKGSFEESHIHSST